MKEVTIIGVDLAKSVFQLHGASKDGWVVFRKKLTRPQFHKFMATHPGCIVAMEACGSAHFWAREMKAIGHSVKLKHFDLYLNHNSRSTEGRGSEL